MIFYNSEVSWRSGTFFFNYLPPNFCDILRDERNHFQLFTRAEIKLIVSHCAAALRHNVILDNTSNINYI